MLDLIIYGFLALCITWDLGLMLYMLIESVQDVAELEDICCQHATREW